MARVLGADGNSIGACCHLRSHKFWTSIVFCSELWRKIITNDRIQKYSYKSNIDPKVLKTVTSPFIRYLLESRLLWMQTPKKTKTFILQNHQNWLTWKSIFSFSNLTKTNRCWQPIGCWDNPEKYSLSHKSEYYFLYPSVGILFIQRSIQGIWILFLSFTRWHNSKFHRYPIQTADFKNLENIYHLTPDHRSSLELKCNCWDGGTQKHIHAGKQCQSIKINQWSLADSTAFTRLTNYYTISSPHNSEEDGSRTFFFICSQFLEAELMASVYASPMLFWYSAKVLDTDVRASRAFCHCPLASFLVLELPLLYSLSVLDHLSSMYLRVACTTPIS